MLDNDLRELGSEFQRTLQEYTRLDLKRSVLGTGILSFPECRDWFSGKISRKRGWDVSGHKFVDQNSLVVVKPFFKWKNR